MRNIVVHQPRKHVVWRQKKLKRKCSKQSVHSIVSPKTSRCVSLAFVSCISSKFLLVGLALKFGLHNVCSPLWCTCAFNYENSSRSYFTYVEVLRLNFRFFGLFFVLFFF